MSFASFVGEFADAAEDGSEKFVRTVHNVMDAGTETGENAQQTVEQSASYVQEETAKQIISLLQTAEFALSQAERMFADYFAAYYNHEAMMGFISKELKSLNADYNDEAMAVASAIGSGGAVGIAVALTIAFAISGASAKETAPSSASRVLNEVQDTLEHLLAARHSAQARQYALMRMGQVSRYIIAIRRQRRALRPYQGELKIILPALQRIHKPLLRLIQTQRRIALKDHTQAIVDVLERLNRALTNMISALQLAENRPRRTNLQIRRRV